MLEIQVSSLKDDLDQEHKRWRTAQDNYERQVSNCQNIFCLWQTNESMWFDILY